MPVPFQHLTTAINEHGAVVHDTVRNRISILNETGGFVWKRVIAGNSIDAIVEELAKETNAEPMLVRSAVMAFMEDLAAKELLPRSELRRAEETEI